MKKIWLKSLVFGICLVLIYVPVSIAIRYFADENFKCEMDNGGKYIVVGNSHGSYALNDSLSKSMINFCRAGEAFYFAESKVKRLLLTNENIKGLCIVLSESQLHGLVVNWVYSSNYMSRAMKSYSFLFPSHLHWELIKGNMECYLKSIFISDKEYLSALIQKQRLTNKSLMWGGFEAITESKFQMNNSAYNDFELPSWDPNIKAIRRIIEFAQERGIQVVFTRLPVHPSFREKTFDQYEKKRLLYFSDVPFLDFSNWKIEERELLDENHLNMVGAKRFTPYFDSLIVSYFGL